MTGMIKKDFIMIKNNFKAIAIALVIFVFYSVMFDMNMAFFLPMMGFMVCMSTISYDEYNNWHTYASTLPQGKINVVKSKYLTTVAVIVSLALISLLISFVIAQFKTNIILEDEISAVLGITFAIACMTSILYPLFFKYGSEKGRIALLLIGLCITGVVLLLTKVVNINIPMNLITFIDKYLPYILLVVAIIMLTISYFVSKRIYLNREF